MGSRVKKTRRKDRAIWRYLNSPSSSIYEEFQKTELQMICSYKSFIGKSQSYLERLEEQFGGDK